MQTWLVVSRAVQGIGGGGIIQLVRVSSPSALLHVDSVLSNGRLTSRSVILSPYESRLSSSTALKT